MIWYMATVNDGSRGGSILIKTQVESHEHDDSTKLIQEQFAEQMAELPWAKVESVNGCEILDMSDVIVIVGDHLVNVLHQVAVLFEEPIMHHKMA